MDSRMKDWIDNKSRHVVIDLISPVLGSLDTLTPTPRTVFPSESRSLEWKHTASCSDKSRLVRFLMYEASSVSFEANGGLGLMGPECLHDLSVHTYSLASSTSFSIYLLFSSLDSLKRKLCNYIRMLWTEYAEVHP